MTDPRDTPEAVAFTEWSHDFEGALLDHIRSDRAIQAECLRDFYAGIGPGFSAAYLVETYARAAKEIREKLQHDAAKAFYEGKDFERANDRMAAE